MPRKNPGPPCRVCGKPSVAHNLCNTHRMRWQRHGHLENTRPERWGQMEKHPLYHSWKWSFKPPGHVPRWDDFWAFVEDVGERPESCTLRRTYANQPVGPENFYWKKPYASMKDGAAAYSRSWREHNPLAVKDFDLRRRCGLTLADYHAMLEAQNGVCAICGGKDATFRLAVDHCHASGEIRGLLCIRCNKGLGMFRDTPEFLRRAIAYLASPPARAKNAA